MKMKTIGIKDLQVNPAILTRSLEADEYAMLTKHSKPIGLAISFKSSIITEGLKTSMMAEAYKQGLLSLGQVAKALDMPKEKVMKILSVMGIDVIDYDFKDDMKSLDSFL